MEAVFNSRRLCSTVKLGATSLLLSPTFRGNPLKARHAGRRNAASSRIGMCVHYVHHLEKLLVSQCSKLAASPTPSLSTEQVNHCVHTFNRSIESFETLLITVTRYHSTRLFASAVACLLLSTLTPGKVQPALQVQSSAPETSSWYVIEAWLLNAFIYMT